MTAVLPKTSVGIKQLAQSLGVSIGTVSRALNNRYGVNPRTRTRILEEARRIGYVPNGAARRLKDHPALTIGLFFAPFLGPNHEINPAALNFVQIMRRQAQNQDASLQTLFFTTEAELRAQTEVNRLDVAVFYGQFAPSVFEAIHGLGIPSILLHYPSLHPDQISVCIDMSQAATTAVEYLAALGHERIALVTGPHTSLHATGFHSGFKGAMDEFGLEYRKDWDFELPTEQANKAGAAEALTPLLQKKDRPTAIVFFSDWLALGGRLAAKNAGLSVPEELSLIGFENMPSSAEIDPPLTTFDVHFPKAAEVVVELAMKLGSGQTVVTLSEDRQILMSAEMVKRGSCICLRKLKQR